MTINCPKCGYQFHVHALSVKERKLYEFVLVYRKEHKVSPTFQQMAEHMGFAHRSTAHAIVHSLIQKGALLHDPASKRSVIPLEELKAA